MQIAQFGTSALELPAARPRPRLATTSPNRSERASRSPARHSADQQVKPAWELVKALPTRPSCATEVQRKHDRLLA